MSGFLILQQRDAVHMLVDGLGYDGAGVVTSVCQKAHALPVLGMAFSTMGHGRAGPRLTLHFRQYRSFDDVIDRGELLLEQWFDDNLDSLRGTAVEGDEGTVGSGADIQLAIAGWSSERERLEAYLIYLADPDNAAAWREAKAGSSIGADPFSWVPLAHVTGNPSPTADDMRAAGLVRHGARSPAELCEMLDPDVDLLALMETQRRTLVNGRHVVGGLALLTTIKPGGEIVQRVIHRWEEDRVGELVEPRPIDWPAWRAARVRAVAEAAGESPLRRQMRERREAKRARGR